MPNSNPRSIAAPDTNILLLRLVADTDISLLQTFKRVRSFDSRDVDLLAIVLEPFRRFVTTPHVLAETSNFIHQAPHYRRADLVKAYQNFIASEEEIYEEARSLAARNEFTTLGLADTGLCSLSDRYTVITMDFHLAGKIKGAGGSVINFEKIRSDRTWPSA